MSEEASADSPDHVEMRIEALGEDFLENLLAGRQADKQALLAANPDIAEPLARRLNLIELMHRSARRSVANEPGQIGLFGNAQRAIHIKCPHCGNHIQLVEPAPPEELTCANCGSSFHVDPQATTTHRPGSWPQRIGRFNLIRRLGQGSFGTVYLASDSDLSRQVALKVPRSGTFPTSEDKERFFREARAAARLDHPNIVRVFEVNHADGIPYIVSAFVEGVTLADRLTASRPGFRESAEMIAQVAEGLDAAHCHGVIHRDVKPSNILLGEHDRPLLTDFGLARRDEGEITVTIDGQILGTPAYMSPEQATGDNRKVDRRSDIYSLGVVLYELLTGDLPFRGNKRMLLHQVLNDDPRAPRALNDRIPRDLETICSKAMAKSPARRYESAAEMANDLRRYLDGQPIRARRTGSLEKLSKWAKRRPAVAGLGASIILITAASMLILAWQLDEVNRARLAATSNALAEAHARQQAQEEEQQVLVNSYQSNIRAAHRDWGSNNVQESLRLLDDCPREMRGWEWNYLDRLCNSELKRISVPNERLTGVALSRDGWRIAAGTERGTIFIWSIATGKQILELHGHTRAVQSVGFSPDGRRLLSASADTTVRVWNVVDGTNLLTYKGHTRPVHSAVFDLEGALVASAGDERTIRVWNSHNGNEFRVFGGHSSAINSLAFAHFGWLLASASSDGTVRLWKRDSPKPLRTLRGHTDKVTCVAFNRNDQCLASGSDDRTVRIWQGDFGAPEVYQDEPVGVGIRSIPYRSHSNAITSVAFSNSGDAFASAGLDKSIHVWETPGLLAIPRVTPLLQLRGHTDAILALSFCPYGRRLVSAGGLGIKLWDTLQSQESISFSATDAGIYSLAFDPSGPRFATGNAGGSLSLWDANTGNKLRTMEGHTSRVTSVVFAPDGKTLVSGSLDKSMRLWNSTTGKLVATFDGHREGVICVAISPDGRRIASGGVDHTISIWDVDTLRETMRLNGHTGLISAIAFAPDGEHLASASYDDTVRIWNLRAAMPETTLNVHTDWVHCLAYSPDGHQLASGSSDRSIAIIESTSGQILNRLRGHKNSVWGIGYLTGGRLASASLDRTLRIWDPVTGQELLTLEGHSAGIHALSLTDDRTRITTIDAVGLVRIWDGSGNLGNHRYTDLDLQQRLEEPHADHTAASDTDVSVRLGKGIDKETLMKTEDSFTPLLATLCVAPMPFPASVATLIFTRTFPLVPREMTLAQALEVLSGRCDLSIMLDREAFVQDYSGFDQIRQKCDFTKGTTIGSLIDDIVSHFGATYVIRHGAILVTTPRGARSDYGVPPDEDFRPFLQDRLAAYVNRDLTAALMPLRDAIEFLHTNYQLAITVDTQAFKADLADDDVLGRTVRMFGAPHETLGAIVKDLAGQVNGSFLLRHNGIEITSGNRVLAEIGSLGYDPRFHDDVPVIPTQEYISPDSKHVIGITTQEVGIVTGAVGQGTHDNGLLPVLGLLTRLRNLPENVVLKGHDSYAFKELPPVYDENFTDHKRAVGFQGSTVTCYNPSGGYLVCELMGSRPEEGNDTEVLRYGEVGELSPLPGSTLPLTSNVFQDGAWLVRANVAIGGSNDGWGLEIAGKKNTAIQIIVRRDQSFEARSYYQNYLDVGKSVVVQMVPPSLPMAHIGPIVRPCIRKDEENTLVLLIKDRKLQLYVNSAPLTDPIPFHPQFEPQSISLATFLDSPGSVIEFKKVLIWQLPGKAIRRSDK